MGLPRIRFTVRRMMTGVLFLGIVFHLAVTTWRVYPSARPHLHTAINIVDGLRGRFTAIRRQPFWPTYWRILRSWRGDPVCPRADGCLLEKCELERPEINGSRRTNLWQPVQQKDQIDLYIELMRNAGRDVRYENGRLIQRIRSP